MGPGGSWAHVGATWFLGRLDLYRFGSRLSRPLHIHIYIYFFFFELANLLKASNPKHKAYLGRKSYSKNRKGKTKPQATKRHYKQTTPKYNNRNKSAPHTKARPAANARPKQQQQSKAETVTASPITQQRNQTPNQLRTSNYRKKQSPGSQDHS
jgi:hypothetical protein